MCEGAGEGRAEGERHIGFSVDAVRGARHFLGCVLGQI